MFKKRSTLQYCRTEDDEESGRINCTFSAIFRATTRVCNVPCKVGKYNIPAGTVVQIDSNQVSSPSL